MLNSLTQGFSIHTHVPQLFSGIPAGQSKISGPTFYQISQQFHEIFRPQAAKYT